MYVFLCMYYMHDPLTLFNGLKVFPGRKKMVKAYI